MVHWKMSSSTRSKSAMKGKGCFSNLARSWSVGVVVVVVGCEWSWEGEEESCGYDRVGGWIGMIWRYVCACVDCWWSHYYWVMDSIQKKGTTVDCLEYSEWFPKKRKESHKWMYVWVSVWAVINHGHDACWRKQTQTDLRNEQNPHHSLDSRAQKQRTFKSRFDMIY